MRLIDAHALRRRFTVNDDGTRISENDCDNLPNAVSIRTIKRMIADAPTIDAAPVAHGAWIYDGDLRCNLCGSVLATCGGHIYRHCPDCGAKMEAGEDA